MSDTSTDAEGEDESAPHPEEELRAKEKRAEREKTEKQAGRAALSLTDREREMLAENQRLSPVTVYAIVRHEGEEEMRRPFESLWWSGVAAGFGISTSVLAEGILHARLAGSPWQAIFENFGYTVGFILVIMSRLQLFTENTITVVLPLLAHPTKETFRCVGRVWGVVFAANLVGTFLTALITVGVGTASPEFTHGMIEISRHFAEMSPGEALRYGIPAGFLIAAIVWMMPSAGGGAQILVVFLFTYLIALGDFSHCIAGSTEVFMLLLEGELGIPGAVALIGPTLVGNVIGGTLLFAVLAYAQVHEEM